MPAGRYLFIPFVRTKSPMGQIKNWSSKKFALKKTDRTNIIATNFVWEQLKTHVYNNCFSFASNLKGQKSIGRFGMCLEWSTVLPNKQLLIITYKLKVNMWKPHLTENFAQLTETFRRMLEKAARRKSLVYFVSALQFYSIADTKLIF